MARMIETTCKTCGARFRVREAEVKRGNGKYCTRKCSTVGGAALRRKSHSPNVECALCKVPIWRPPSRVALSKSGLHFCCKEHMDKAKRIDGGIVSVQPDHYGTAGPRKPDQHRRQEEVCLFCGRTSAMRMGQKYCSRLCSKSARRERALRDQPVKNIYRRLAKFNFSLNSYPDAFDFSLIERHGWYKPSNSRGGGNLQGVSRDHLLAVMDGFRQMVNPSLLAHPANCELKTQPDNFAKKAHSDITVDQLLVRIQEWNRKYGEEFSVSHIFITVRDLEQMAR